MGIDGEVVNNTIPDSHWNPPTLWGRICHTWGWRLYDVAMNADDLWRRWSPFYWYHHIPNYLETRGYCCLRHAK